MGAQQACQSREFLVAELKDAPLRSGQKGKVAALQAACQVGKEATANGGGHCTDRYPAPGSRSVLV